MKFLSPLKCLLFVAISLFFAINLSLASNQEEVHADQPFDITSMIMHHIQDAHEIHLWGETSIYLPILLVDNGITSFSSKHVYHGTLQTTVDPSTNQAIQYVVGVGPAQGYAIFHEKVYKLVDGELQFEHAHPINQQPLDISMTKNVVVLFLVSILLCWIAFSTARYYVKNGAVAPKGIAKFIEPLVIFVRDDIAKANIGEAKYKKYLPYLLTVFFFILLSNLLGLVPILSANLTGNIAITLFLAVCTLLLTVLSGNKNYWKHIFATPGVPLVLLPIMIPIELAGILTKPFALMIRLFANITAGHVIILALIGMIFINKNAAWGALSVPMALFISVLEILVAFLQAYLFAMLSALFIGAAVEEHH